MTRPPNFHHHLPDQPQVFPFDEDEHLYGRPEPATAEIKARADAEWDASDWRGRLPKGWTWKPASNLREKESQG